MDITQQLTVRENGIGGFSRDFSSDWVAIYMASERRAVDLINACLDFPSTAQNNPLAYLLDNDMRDREIKSKSVAYLYALLRLLAMPSTEEAKESLSKLVEIGFPMKILVRAFIIEAPRIVASLSTERSRDGYNEIANSNYVYFLTALLDPGNQQYTEKERHLLIAFLRYQLLFSSSPASVIAHYLPVIGNETDSLYFMDVGEISKYPNEILWLMREIFQRGASAQSGDMKDLEMELGEGFWNVVRHFRPEDVERAKGTLVEYGREVGISERFIKGLLDADADLPPSTQNMPEAEGVRQVLLSIFGKYPPISQLSQEQARQLANELRNDLINPETQRREYAFRVIGNLISLMYDMSMPQKNF